MTKKLSLTESIIYMDRCIPFDPTNTWKSEKMLVKMTLTFISLNWQNDIETRLPENFS